MIEQFYDIQPNVLELDRQALALCSAQFAKTEQIRDYNQLKMLRAFTDCGVEARHLVGSTGYGVWDDSRNKLEQVFCKAVGAEDALVRPQFMSGTHTIAVALFGLLRPGNTLLAATGRPYDTLEGVIGLGEAGKGCGTLREYGIQYDEAPLTADSLPDYPAIRQKAATATVVHIQRSRGYTQRNAFSLEVIGQVVAAVREVNPAAVIFVDNCYGEFTQTAEPLAVGADIIAGSFIKNPGGGITPTGGYIAGKAGLVEKISHRFTAPGIGKDLGCTQDNLRAMFLGLYYAPGVVCEALKTAIYAQCLLALAGVHPVPAYTEEHNDIVTCFDSGSEAALQGFCSGIQQGSPVDSLATPEPAEEPGYTDKVIMAAGAFTEGSTIELSCDGPLRPPYTCYLQGGVNFTAGRAAVLCAVQNAFFAKK
ncbi:MAG: methionine gamma-lyase family protein [Gemmiger sp.]|nr:methionine gamma-lyase family protein [Gemmiger sp.]